MKNYNVLGCDLSINGSGFTLIECDENFTQKSVKFLGFTKVKKLEHHSENMHICLLDKSYGDVPYHHRGEIIFDTLCKYFDIDSLDFFATEDYAFGATGHVFDIAEVCGAIKEKLYCKNIPYKKFSPPSIKKFATGKGNADKLLMGIEFNKLGIVLPFELKDYESPKADIVDSFWIAQLLRFELFYRKFGKFPTDLFKTVPEHSWEAIIGGGKKSKTDPTLVLQFYSKDLNKLLF